MKLYDIIQIEDDPHLAGVFSRSAKKHEVSYLRVSSLKELESCLAEKNYAKVYIVDGNFPEAEGERIQFLAPKALEMIKKHCLESKVILYSSNDLSKLAEENNAEYVSKGVVAVRLVEKIKQMLN
ncbi:hypothetical protein KY308_03585 [Candidatus Woesearchaeota archaeon]|nr:hypothetical protein [Candidatus Woesearchaeota archaeon]